MTDRSRATAHPVEQPVEDLKKLLGDGTPANDVLPHGTPANDVLPHGTPANDVVPHGEAPAAAAQPEGAKLYDFVAPHADYPPIQKVSGDTFAPSASMRNRPPPRPRPTMPAGNPDFAPRVPEPPPPKTQPAPPTHPNYREMPKGPGPKRTPWTERMQPPAEKNPGHSPDVLDHGQPRDLLPVKEPPPGMTRGNMVHQFWRQFKELGVDIDRMWGESRKYLYDAEGNALPHVVEKPVRHGELPRKYWGRVDAENLPGRQQIEIGPENLRAEKSAESALYADEGNRFHDLADPQNPFEGIFAGYNEAYADELAEFWGLVEKGKKR